MISLSDISKTYAGQEQPAVDRLDLDVNQGELLVLVGESGCGKTTTLKMINRLVEPDCGQISINDKDIASFDPIKLRRSIGYVIQQIGLFPHLTVAENIGLIPMLSGWPEAKVEARVKELLSLVGLDGQGFSNRRPGELSGGQQQRVGLARALATKPKLMLMDEPFGALDPITRATIVEQFQAIQAQLGLTIVMVTHDMTEALLLADSLAVMKAGRIVSRGTPSELLANPGHEYTEKLLSTPLNQAARLAEIAKKGPAK